jgi:hypothetical protein
MHGLTGGSWKRSGHRATATGKNDLMGNHKAISGPETYRRPTPPRQLSTLLRLAEGASTFRDLDGWLRRRLRQIHWKHWKTAAARRHNLRIRGIPERDARKWGSSGKGYWRVAGSGILQVSLPNTYWTRLDSE